MTVDTDKYLPQSPLATRAGVYRHITPNDKDRIARRRMVTYAVFVAVVVGVPLMFHGSDWRGSIMLHTLMESIATLLAMVVGCMALVRYYSRKDNTFLFVGAGFLGTSFLDAYHALVTSEFLRSYMPSDLASLIPWSWVASRQFLAILMFMSWVAWLHESRLGKAGRVNERMVYLFTGGFALASFFFFALVSLPRAHFPTILLHRPEEIVPGIFFLVALVGYLRKGKWRDDSFEHWLVLSLFMGVISQFVFMSHSGQVFDYEFDVAHLMKKISYVCVLIGLLINMFVVFHRAEKSEQRFRGAIASMQEGIALFDDEDRLIVANYEYLRLHQNVSDMMRPGMRFEDMIRAGIGDGTTVGAAGREEEHIRERMEHHRNPGATIFRELTDGTWYIINESRTPGGGTAVTETDITELKRAETLLREKADLEKLLHRIAVSANDAESVDDAMRACLNDVCGFTGWPVGHLYTLAPGDGYRLVPSDIWHLSDPQRFAPFRAAAKWTEFTAGTGLLGRVIASRQPAWIEDVTKDANFVRADIARTVGIRSGFALPVLANKKVVAILEFFTDRTVTADSRLIQGLAPLGALLGRVIERVESQEFLKDSEGRIRAIVENVAVGIITIDEHGIIGSFNTASENIFGFASHEVIGENVSILMPPPYQDEHDGYIHHYRKTGEKRIIGIGREVTGRRKNGAVFPMDLMIGEVLVAGRREFTGIVQDITERKKIERMKSEFISTVSHELRTPLTSIMGALGLLRGGAGGAVPKKAASMIDIAYSNSDRLVRLINDILDTEKIESGRMEFRMEALDVMAQVKRAISENTGYAERHKTMYVLKDSLPGVKVIGDKDRLLQVMANLLSNAAKFSPDDDRVEIAVGRTEGRVRISVTDHGSGIPLEFQDRIFDKFSQFDSSDTRQKTGTGLGLSISKAIVEGHEGRIGFDSKPGRGTTFYFEIPEWRDDRAAAPSAAKEGEKRQRILICEDEPDIAALLKLILGRGGYATDVTRTAAETKEKLGQHHYAMMTLDLALPDQNGVSMIHEIRKHAKTRHLPVIVISAKASESRETFADDGLGVVEWLDKPIDQDGLMATVARVTAENAEQRSQILHVEDDPDVLTIVSTLVDDLADVSAATTLGQADVLLRQNCFDLIILDMILPDGPGESLLRALRQHGHADTPVIIFSVKEVSSEIAGSVTKTLVKSRTTNEQLLGAIRALIPDAELIAEDAI